MNEVVVFDSLFAPKNGAFIRREWMMIGDNWPMHGEHTAYQLAKSLMLHVK